jgi:nicotinamidase-related amidase
MASFASAADTAAVPKRILLIIDPQNDFMDIRDKTRISDETRISRLPVANARNDMGKIAKMLATVELDNKFDEIHVSLDTHSKQHIGNPKFWQVKDTDHPDHPVPHAVWELSVVKDEDGTESKIKGTNIIHFLAGQAHGDGIVSDIDTITVEPVDHQLLAYAKAYVSKVNEHADYAFKEKHGIEQDDEINDTLGEEIMNNYRSERGLRPTIWYEHCIPRETTETNKLDGHAVYSELKDALDKKTNVYYHIKGQNNLTEMYSIFKAEVQPAEVGSIPDTVVSEQLPNQDDPYSPAVKYAYEEVIEKTNYKTDLDNELLKILFGANNKNTVYVCGEASTHCVMQSMKDMFDYAVVNGINLTQIVLLENASSPIGPINPLPMFVTEKGGKLMSITTDDKLSDTTVEKLAAEKLAAATEKGGARKTKRRRTTRKNRRANKRTNKRNKRRISHRR